MVYSEFRYGVCVCWWVDFCQPLHRALYVVKDNDAFMRLSDERIIG